MSLPTAVAPEEIAVSHCLLDARAEVLDADGAERPYYAASTIKLHVLLAALREAAGGRLDLSGTVPATRTFIGPGGAPSTLGRSDQRDQRRGSRPDHARRRDRGRPRPRAAGELARPRPRRAAGAADPRHRPCAAGRGPVGVEVGLGGRVPARRRLRRRSGRRGPAPAGGDDGGPRPAAGR